MKNIKSFSLFEANNYPYSKDQVTSLPIFGILKSMGFEDSTSDAIWNNGNLRLYNGMLNMEDPSEALTIYGNGYIRKTVDGRPYVLKTLGEIRTLEDWNERFLYVLEWTKKRYKSRKGLIFDYSDTDSLNFGKVMSDIYRQDIDLFMKMYDDMKDSSKELFLKEIGQGKSEFDSNLAKYMSIRKRVFLI
jgi:hypothetical protein